MGNPASKEGTSNIERYQQQWEEEYKKCVESANITGNTWEEFEQKLSKHVNNTTQIEKEWEFLQQKDTIVSRAEDLYKEALKAHNKSKNRYLNILPFDSTRVKVTGNESTAGSDFINANWVTSVERTYICAQAPLEHTVDDFHKMLWETNTGLVVMLTKLVELGKVKAHEYLPRVGEGPRKYGEIEVEVISDEPSEDQNYVIRKFTLTKDGQKKTVTQFHYLAWPDHGVPDVTKPLLDMIIHADTVFPPSSSTKDSPTVVHCSAGVGRTGTYVIVNSILESFTQHMKKNPNEPPSVNLMKTLHDLREMRSGLVNHAEQYEFCYKTIHDHVRQLIQQRNDSKK